MMNFHASDFTLHPFADDSNLELREAIALHIAQSPQQRITFAEYMDWALYHPEYGYYSTNVVKLGKEGDFFTSAHLGADFGELLAEQFLQMWEILGKPAPFTLVEMGAGQGILAADVLSYLHKHYFEFFDAIEYIIVEKSLALKKEQQRRLQGFPLQWCSLEEIPSASIIGCGFSNELVDAFPVHQFTIKEGELQEVYVSFDRNNFVEITGKPSTSQLNDYFDLIGIKLPSNAYPDGYRSEVNLAALDWLSLVTAKLQRGYLLTIDYGYAGDRYYSPVRNRGTLQCYYRHRRHDNPYVHIGRQDITAHVDFTAVERWGKKCGLQTVGFTQQALFLMALGLGDRLASLAANDVASSEEILSILQRRDALHQLIDPIGLGNFGVLIQSNGLTEAEKAYPLKGLSMLS